MDEKKQSLKNKVIIEAAHIYTNESPGIEQILEIEAANFIGDVYKKMGYQVENWVFVDDYNPKFCNEPTLYSEPDYVDFLNSKGFKPDNLTYESSLVSPAKDLLQILINDNNTISCDGKVKLSKGNILLFDEEKQKYSCAILDACYYQKKLQNANYAITVLPMKYCVQQKDTLTILKKAGVYTQGIFPYYYDNYMDVSSDILKFSGIMQMVTILSSLNNESKNDVESRNDESKVLSYGI